MDNMLGNEEVPIGFGMELAKNLDAMRSFAAMDETEKSQVLDRASHVSSKREMEQFVAQLHEKD